ncbi:hypothetical protein D3C80_1750980 [compost metagenome]
MVSVAGPDRFDIAKAVDVLVAGGGIGRQEIEQLAITDEVPAFVAITAGRGPTVLVN